MTELSADAIVIGGGFFGCETALHLRRLGLEKIILVEREAGLLRRASFVNQARIHNGYHYPRSYPTAIRSRESFLRFAGDYREAVVDTFVKLYAIARGSRVSATQFASFCNAIGASCRPAAQSHRNLFDFDLVEQCFVTQEFAFDATRLATKLTGELNKAGIDLRIGTNAELIRHGSSSISVRVGSRTETAPWLFNCTYRDLDRTGIHLQSRIKKELAEIVLIEPPLPMRNLGVTVMDGPYFSTMPFPAARLHSLTHVRYTPHEATEVIRDTPPDPVRSNRHYMLRDAARYMPILGGAKVVRSIFEIKAVLVDREADDGRPILIERSKESDRIISILGAKLDNIYDVREYLSRQCWK